VPQGRGTFPDLTVEDNLRCGAYTRKDAIAEDLDRWFTQFPRLEQRRTQKAGSLSGASRLSPRPQGPGRLAVWCQPQALLLHDDGHAGAARLPEA
jgi:ABC-type branched-subunit amino acid transport system ATPase component